MRDLLFSLVLHILAGNEPQTTDDTWDCWTEDNGSVEVCERELSPCHFVVSEAECVIVVKRVKLGTEAWCDLNDPLACLPDA